LRTLDTLFHDLDRFNESEHGTSHRQSTIHKGGSA
jgi:hypothetical protein